MLRKRSPLFLFLPLVALQALSGCGHAPVKGEGDPRSLLAQACSPGAAIRSSKGTVWVKANSKDASGQFPAVVDAPSPDRLKMEITNLTGGTEAILSVEGRRYKIEVPNRKDRSGQGEGSWGGIPLQWANALFLGRIPCPADDSSKSATVSRGGEGELIVEVPKSLARMPERYVYKLREVEGAAWPESLHWERQGIQGSAPVTVDFKFEEPEATTRSPKRWEAKGAQGEVKVKWRERTVQS